MNVAARWILALFGISAFLSMAAMEFLGGFACVAFFLGLRARAEKRAFFQSLRTGLEKYFLFFFLACALSFLFGEFSWVRLDLFLQVRWILLVYFLYFCFLQVRSEKEFIGLVRPMIAFAILIALYAVFQRYTGIDLYRGGPGKVKASAYAVDTFRAVGMFSNPITFGNAMAMLASWLLAAVFYLKTWREKIWVGLAFTLATVAVLFSYTRGAYIGLAAGILAVTLTLGSRTRWMVFTAGLLAVVAVFVIDQDLAARVRSIFSLSHSSNLSRLYIWQAHFAMFKDHPIFGVGYNYNAWAVEPYFQALAIPKSEWQLSHAHNNILQFLGGTGLVGAIAYLALTFKIFAINISALRDRTLERPWVRTALAGFLGVHVSFFVAGLTESTFRDSELRNAFLFFLVMALWTLRRRPELTPQK